MRSLSLFSSSCDVWVCAEGVSGGEGREGAEQQMWNTRPGGTHRLCRGSFEGQHWREHSSNSLLQPLTSNKSHQSSGFYLCTSIKTRGPVSSPIHAWLFDVSSSVRIYGCVQNIHMGEWISRIWRLWPSAPERNRNPSCVIHTLWHVVAHVVRLLRCKWNCTCWMAQG